MKFNVHAILQLGVAALLLVSSWLHADDCISGTVTIGNLNCTACHTSSEQQKEWIQTKLAPSLNDIGNRVSAEWLQRYLASPQNEHPGTTMPDLLHGDTGKAEALTQFLISKGENNFRRVVPDRAAVARGESIYHRVGCVACHAPQNGSAMPIDSVPLPRLDKKWAFMGLKNFLLDPLSVRPSGRMPSMNLTEREAADVAHYLLRETHLPASAEVAFYSDRIRSLESLDSANAVQTAPVSGFTLDGILREKVNAIRISTWLDVKVGGEYTFFLKATGASRLSIAGRWSLGEESWEKESVDEKYDMDLKPGRYELKLDFVRRGKIKPALLVEWQGPGIVRQTIPKALMSREREPSSDLAVEVPTFISDAAKIEQGRLLYQSLNCAACHEGKSSNNSLPSLSDLDTTRGCLAAEPKAPTPDFHFSSESRATVIKALGLIGIGLPDTRQRVAISLNSFRCLSCHVRDGSGGVSTDRSTFFTSNVDDLGDQGRIPPHLDGVGDKLRLEWLTKVLTEGSVVRPYLNTRMPQFGSSNVGKLADWLVEIDRHPNPILPVEDSPSLQREVGRQLVGTDGLSCIACHQFNRQPAHSMQVIDLTTTTDRLNEDWFRKFLRNPNDFQAGTRMPSLWPNGKCLLPNLVGGDVDRQHAALWTYLSDGINAKFPEGLSRKNMEIVVGGEAVLYRGKIKGAGFRAIALGYPGQVNAAFDSNEGRLALVWRGRFLDVSPHWSNQGMGEISPLGGDVVRFPSGSAFAVLANNDSPWPNQPSKELGLKFIGYQLDAEKRPTLIYSFSNLKVEDLMTSSDKRGLRRELKFTGIPLERLYYKLAAGKLVPTCKKSWRLNGELTITVNDETTPFVRGRGDKMELLVPIQNTGPNHLLKINYDW